MSDPAKVEPLIEALEAGAYRSAGQAIPSAVLSMLRDGCTAIPRPPMLRVFCKSVMDDLYEHFIHMDLPAKLGIAMACC